MSPVSPSGPAQVAGVSPLAAVDAALAAVFLALAAGALRSRDRPGATAAGALFSVLAAATGGIALARGGVVAAETAVFGLFGGWLLAVPLWAAFVFAYTARGPVVTRARAAAGAAYVTAVGVATAGAALVGGTLAPLVQVAVAVSQLSVLGLGLVGGFLPVHAALAYDDLPLGQAALLSVGGVAASLVLASLVGAAPETGAVPATATGVLALAGGAFATASVLYRPFETVPGTGYLGREAVLAETSEAVVVTDRNGRVVDANDAAERTLGVSASADAGRHVEAVLGTDPTGNGDGDGFGDGSTDTDGSTDANGLSVVETPAGRRRFDVSRSTLTDEAGESVGTASLFRDVTERHLRRQRLEVLDRVLRHNLRNDLDAVRGFAEALGSDDALDDADVARRIRETATDLADLGTAVARAERVTAGAELDAERVDVVALGRRVASDVAGDDAGSRVTVAARGDRPTVRTDAAVLRTALVELVENALEHGAGPADATGRDDPSDPAVTVAVADVEGGVRIAVRDDGPGVPEREREILRGGEETQLRHGTGVGLWLASWAVTRLGGDFEFEADGDASGTDGGDAGAGDGDYAGADDASGTDGDRAGETGVVLWVPDRTADAAAA